MASQLDFGVGKRGRTKTSPSSSAIIKSFFSDGTQDDIDLERKIRNFIWDNSFFSIITENLEKEVK